MKKTHDYLQKLETSIEKLPFQKLEMSEQNFIVDEAKKHMFSFQELRILVDISIDLRMWKEGNLKDYWPDLDAEMQAKHRRERVLRAVRGKWEKVKSSEKDYSSFEYKDVKRDFPKISLGEPKETNILGECPVASPKTLCCNLKTLDAVQSCAFDCSYCSIQSFYTEGKITFEPNLFDKLKKYPFDPNKIYHIGTGQSSDSLVWGNKFEVLEELLSFAKNNQNIIFELKTKSKNIKHLIDADVPKNIICTWSINTDTIIEHEEKLTATLDQRLRAARKMVDKGLLVGFHFHPMVYYKGWEADYKEAVDKIKSMFKKEEVSHISLGTLTFIKPVIKKIRSRKFYSKILQMPFEDAEGKLSYPEDIKMKLFKHLYDCFEGWHDDVYFYLCMENRKFWKPVFGYEYADNDEFEEAMKSSYMAKIKSLTNQ